MYTPSPVQTSHLVPGRNAGAVCYSAARCLPPLPLAATDGAHPHPIQSAKWADEHKQTSPDRPMLATARGIDPKTNGAWRRPPPVLARE